MQKTFLFLVLFLAIFPLGLEGKNIDVFNAVLLGLAAIIVLQVYDERFIEKQTGRTSFPVWFGVLMTAIVYQNREEVRYSSFFMMAIAFVVAVDSLRTYEFLHFKFNIGKVLSIIPVLINTGFLYYFQRNEIPVHVAAVMSGVYIYFCFFEGPGATVTYYPIPCAIYNFYMFLRIGDTYRWLLFGLFLQFSIYTVISLGNDWLETSVRTKSNVKGFFLHMTRNDKPMLISNALTLVFIALHSKEDLFVGRINVPGPIQTAAQFILSAMEGPIKDFMAFTGSGSIGNVLDAMLESVAKVRNAVITVHDQEDFIISLATNFEKTTTFANSPILMTLFVFYAVSSAFTFFVIGTVEKKKHIMNSLMFKIVTSLSLTLDLLMMFLLQKSVEGNSTISSTFHAFYWIVMVSLAQDVCLTIWRFIVRDDDIKRANQKPLIDRILDFKTWKVNTWVFVPLALFGCAIMFIVIAALQGGFINEFRVGVKNQRVEPFVPSSYDQISKMGTMGQAILKKFNMALWLSQIVAYMIDQIPCIDIGISPADYNVCIGDLVSGVLSKFFDWFQEGSNIVANVLINQILPGEVNLGLEHMLHLDTLTDALRKDFAQITIPSIDRTYITILAIVGVCLVVIITLLSMLDPKFRSLEKFASLTILNVMIGLLLSLISFSSYLPSNIYVSFSLTSSGNLFCLGIALFIGGCLIIFVVKPTEQQVVTASSYEFIFTKPPNALLSDALAHAKEKAPFLFVRLLEVGHVIEVDENRFEFDAELEDFAMDDNRYSFQPSDIEEPVSLSKMAFLLKMGYLCDQNEVMV